MSENRGDRAIDSGTLEIYPKLLEYRRGYILGAGVDIVEAG